MARLLLSQRPNKAWRTSVLSVQIDDIREGAVVECEGRIVRSDAAYKLREAVCAKTSNALSGEMSILSRNSAAMVTLSNAIPK